jgi:transposase-like protein
MSKLSSIEELFAGRHFDREVIIDETYIKVRGQWVYLYRAVDKAGQTIDFRLSRTRDVAAAHHHVRWLCRVASSGP